MMPTIATNETADMPIAIPFDAVFLAVVEVAGAPEEAVEEGVEVAGAPEEAVEEGVEVAVAAPEITKSEAVSIVAVATATFPLRPSLDAIDSSAVKTLPKKDLASVGRPDKKSPVGVAPARISFCRDCTHPSKEARAEGSASKADAIERRAGAVCSAST